MDSVPVFRAKLMLGSFFYVSCIAEVSGTANISVT